jgi:hypothetical protein
VESPKSTRGRQKASGRRRKGKKEKGESRGRGRRRQKAKEEREKGKEEGGERKEKGKELAGIAPNFRSSDPGELGFHAFGGRIDGAFKSALVPFVFGRWRGVEVATEVGEPHRVTVVPKNCCESCLLKKLESVKWGGGTVREYAVHFVTSVQGNKSHV